MEKEIEYLEGCLDEVREKIKEYVKRECHRIGKYNPKTRNKHKSNSFSYAEVKKILGLK